MAREEHDPLWGLRQGFQWQDELDYRACLIEFDVAGIIERFRATNPPSDALKEFDARLEKLHSAIRANLGRPPRRWELEALRELRDFAGETPSAPPVEPPAATPLHREPEGRDPEGISATLPAPAEPEEWDDTAKPLAPPSEPVEPPKTRARVRRIAASEKKKLIAHARATWGRLDRVPNREATKPALEAKFGREIHRDDYRQVMSAAFPGERKGGRPKAGGL
jgi:hypothetical protein